ncbi:MAG TPA: hypothetical protein VMJ10_28900 [Kofleriaceae bacterium]|nr:hypothetical protein [Kofleriaceae bacterium]
MGAELPGSKPLGRATRLAIVRRPAGHQVRSPKPKPRTDPLTWNLSALDRLAQRALRHVEDGRSVLDIEKLVLVDIGVFSYPTPAPVHEILGTPSRRNANARALVGQPVEMT